MFSFWKQPEEESPSPQLSKEDLKQMTHLQKQAEEVADEKSLQLWEPDSGNEDELVEDDCESVDEIDVLEFKSPEKKEGKISYNKVQKAWINEVNEKLNSAGILSRGYSRFGYDTRKWDELYVPKTWEKQNIQFDGAMWVKRDITIPKEWRGKELTLNLGPINDFDITWFNGKQVGSMPSVGMFRSYSIPKEILKDGKNEITVLILDIVNSLTVPGL